MDHAGKVFVFSEQMERIRLVTGAYTQTELAVCLGIRQSSVSNAKRHGAVPAEWLLTLACSLNVNPDWILTGKGEMHLEAPGGIHDGPEAAREIAEAMKALRRLPSKVLADELLRRIALAESERPSH